MKTAAFIIIGNEILSGRTQDKNLNYLAQYLGDFGIDFIEARIIQDNQDTIIKTIHELKKTVDYIFTSGGIGPTHDDITADSVAAACGVSIDMRDDAVKILTDYYGQEHLNPARLRMARIPDGAILIDNPVTKAPGFYLDNIFVLAGIPRVQQAMLESITHLFSGQHAPIQTICVRTQSPESFLADMMGQLQNDYPDINIGSYPYSVGGIYATRIVLRGHDMQKMNQLYEILCEKLHELSVSFVLEEQKSA